VGHHRSHTVIFDFNSALFALASDFIGKNAPYQGVRVEPLPGGQGVLVMATNRGATVFAGIDRAGTADGAATFLPGKDIPAKGRGIKTSKRSLFIDTAAGIARVTTHHKTAANEITELPAPLLSSVPFPPLKERLGDCLRYWNHPGDGEISAGSYGGDELLAVIKAARSLGDSISLSGFSPGGPLRVQVHSERVLQDDVVLLVIPQSKIPVPPPPAWLNEVIPTHASPP
jgi:hypothetical protein